VTVIAEAEKARRRAALRVGVAQSPLTAVTYAAKMLGDISPKALGEWARNDAECRTFMPRAQTDPAIQAAMDAVKTGMVPALAWAKTKPDGDGNSFSVLLKPKVDETDLLERLVAAFENVTPSLPITAPSMVCADLLSLYPIFDAHIGMHAWGAETGGDDYDLKLARGDMAAAFGKVMALTPSSAEAILLVGGDYFHIDDSRNETPASRHRLDADGRYQKVIDTGVDILIGAIDGLLAKHDRVQLRVMRGNHDEHSSVILPNALYQRYRLEPRIEVVKDPRDLFMRQWGTSAIFAHHGDKTPLQKIVNILCDICPFWSSTKHRHYFSGDKHRFKSEDLGPLVVETMRPFCPPDSYGSRWASRRAFQSVTFHREDGLVQRNYDPIQRAA